MVLLRNSSLDSVSELFVLFCRCYNPVKLLLDDAGIGGRKSVTFDFPSRLKRVKVV